MMVPADEIRGLDPVDEAIRLFNDRYFFEAHEVLEDVWRLERDQSRIFLQGLIQLCAAYHHTQNGNLVGAITLLERGAEKMRRFPSGHLGIETTLFLARVDATRGLLERRQQGEPSVGEIEYPRIERKVSR